MKLYKKEYIECNNCKLCDIVLKSIQDRKIEDIILGQTDHFIWVPGLGSFLEGYSLVLSKDHVFNTGCFNDKNIDELELFINKIRRVLYKLYKKDSIVFEHGSMGNRNYAGGCIEHHHLHVLPADLSYTPKILLSNFTKHTIIKSMKDLIEFNQKCIPYIYYVPISGEHHIFEVQVLPRQYMRQVIAAECGCSQDWDWREKPFIENIISFVEKIKKLRKE